MFGRKCSAHKRVVQVCLADVDCELLDARARAFNVSRSRIMRELVRKMRDYQFADALLSVQPPLPGLVQPEENSKAA